VARNLGLLLCRFDMTSMLHSKCNTNHSVLPTDSMTERNNVSCRYVSLVIT